jgi:rare lipoprotein A
MNPSHLTAAHKSLQFGTKLKVTNQRNGKSVVVRINDRGPFHKGRVIDVSKAAAGQLGMIGSGVGRICYEVVG